MFIGNDRHGNRRVDINDAIQKDEYFCPLCNARLVQKCGNKRVHHFAHCNGSECDEWSSDMSEWHRSWQNLFPEECREVVVELNGNKHRADILINNTVVEFQHSRMTNEEFLARNSFYTQAGYRLIWLFDFREEVRKGKILYHHDTSAYKEYVWKWASHTFDFFTPEDSNIVIFIQLSGCNEKCIELLVQLYYCNTEFATWKNFILSQEEFKSVIYGERQLPDYRPQREITEDSSERYEEYEQYRNSMKKPRTIYEIMVLCRENIIIVYNQRTNITARIGVSQYRKRKDFKVKGVIKHSGRRSFSRNVYEIPDAEKPEWILEDECMSL